MTRNLAAAAIAAIAFSLPAQAETVDLATVKCSELATMDQEAANFMFAWLLGYTGGQAGVTTLDLGDMDSIGEDIGKYCAANPDVGLVSATLDVLTD